MGYYPTDRRFLRHRSYIVSVEFRLDLECRVESNSESCGGFVDAICFFIGSAEEVLNVGGEADLGSEGDTGIEIEVEPRG